MKIFLIFGIMIFGTVGRITCVIVHTPQCEIEVDLTYSQSGYPPRLSCHYGGCKNTISTNWYQQRIYYQDEKLKKDSKLMVVIDFNSDKDLECTFQPAATDDEIRTVEKRLTKLSQSIYNPEEETNLEDSKPVKHKGKEANNSSVEDSCQEGFIYVKDLESCYHISEKQTDWHDAECQCHGMKGRLAVINSSKKQDALADILSNKSESVWIGLSDLRKEGEYVWSDGSLLEFESWSAGQPKNEGYYDEEDCVEMYANINFSWNDEGCEAQRRYLCEPTTDSPNMSICPEGWLLNNETNVCYFISDGQQNWNTSKTLCSDMQGSLASVLSETENNFIKDLLTEKKVDVWLGLTDIQDEDAFQWEDGSPFSYQNFESGSPDNGGFWSIIGGEEDCIEMSAKHSYRWNDYKCNENLYALCKKKAETLPRKKCPEGWEPDSYTNCYRSVSKPTTFTEATKICVRMQYGAELSLPSNKEHNKIIAAQMRSNKIWTGLRDLNKNNTFTTLSNEVPSFTNWAKDQPAKTQFCAQIMVNGLWRSASCNSKQPFICMTSQFEAMAAQEE